MTCNRDDFIAIAASPHAKTEFSEPPYSMIDGTLNSFDSLMLPWLYCGK